MSGLASPAPRRHVGPVRPVPLSPAASSVPELPVLAEFPSWRRDRDAQAAGNCPLPFLPCPQGRCGGGRLRQPFLERNGGARPREASLQGPDGRARLRELSLQMHYGGAQLRQLPIRGVGGAHGATPLQGSEGHHGRANGICLLRGTEAAMVEPFLSDLSPQTRHGGALRDPSP